MPLKYNDIFQTYFTFDVTHYFSSFDIHIGCFRAAERFRDDDIAIFLFQAGYFHLSLYGLRLLYFITPAVNCRAS